MTKSYLAALAVLQGETICPVGVDHAAFISMKARKARNELFVGTKAAVVWRRSELAAIGDLLAEGQSFAGIVEAGFDRSDVQMAASAWVSAGKPLVEPAPAADDRPNENTRFAEAVESVRDMLAGIDELLSTQDGVHDVLSTIEQMGQRLTLPAFYFSVHRDQDQQQPFEVSFGATIREKAQ